MRYQILDGFRGFFLIYMLIAHVNVQLRTVIAKYSHHTFGWVEDAQGFVFISGLVIGLVYGKRLIRYGNNVMHNSLISRQKTIYMHYICILLALYILYILFKGNTNSDILDSYEYGLRYIFTSAIFVSASSFMDILPMYLVFMCFTGFVLNLMYKGRTAFVFAISALLWVMAQSHGYDLALDAMRRALGNVLGGPIGETPHFDMFAWQAIYFFGLAVGFHMADGKLDLRIMGTKPGGELAVFCLVSVVLLAIFKRMSYSPWFGDELMHDIVNNQNRNILSPIYMYAFFVDLYLISWLIIFGQKSSISAVEFLARIFNKFFSSKWLVYLGQHSLQVYAFHIFVVYLISVMFDGKSVGQLNGVMLTIAGIISLYIPAFAHDKWVKFWREKSERVTADS